MRGYPRKNNQPEASRGEAEVVAIPPSWEGTGYRVEITHEETQKTFSLFVPIEGMNYREAVFTLSAMCCHFGISKEYATRMRFSLATRLMNPSSNASLLREVFSYLSSLWPDEFMVYVEQRKSA